MESRYHFSNILDYTPEQIARTWISRFLETSQISFGNDETIDIKARNRAIAEAKAS